jgi:hypothetical protein
MIKNDTIKIFISYRNKTHYLKLGYKPILNQELEIKTEHLPTSSHVKVDVICSICKNENNIQYDKYIRNIKRHNFYGCKKCSRQKAALTSVDKYGVDNYSKTDEWKKRVEDTNIKKYGYKTNLLCPEFKENIKSILLEKYGTEKFWEIRESNGKNKKLKLIDIIDIDIIDILKSEDLYSNFLDIDDINYVLYRNECRRITNFNTKELMNNWNSLDYYDNYNISENFKLDHNDPSYPTIDHKISVYFGFINKIDPTEIGSIDNLCITKRSINSKKREMIESEFIKFINL